MNTIDITFTRDQLNNLNSIFWDSLGRYLKANRHLYRYMPLSERWTGKVKMVHYLSDYIKSVSENTNEDTNDVTITFTQNQLNIFNDIILNDSFDAYIQASWQPNAHPREAYLAEEVRKLSIVIDNAVCEQGSLPWEDKFNTNLSTPLANLHDTALY